MKGKPRMSVQNSHTEALIKAFQSGIESGIEIGRIVERNEIYVTLRDSIVHGSLPGNGCDKTAERNGIITCVNAIYDRGGVLS
jgi:hypothetical protein